MSSLVYGKNRILRLRHVKTIQGKIGKIIHNIGPYLECWLFTLLRSISSEIYHRNNAMHSLEKAMALS